MRRLSEVANCLKRASGVRWKAWCGTTMPKRPGQAKEAQEGRTTARSQVPDGRLLAVARRRAPRDLALYHDRSLVAWFPSCPLTITMLSHLIDSLPDNIQAKAQTLIDRVPEGIQRTE